MILRSVNVISQSSPSFFFFVFSIHRDISLLEKELLSPSTPSSHDDKDEIQKKIIICCKELIICYPQVAASKNIDNILWKHCYYRNIEAYRKRIRQLSTILEKLPVPSHPSPHLAYRGQLSHHPGGGGAAAEVLKYQEHKQHLMQMSSALNQYLSHAAAFYESFLMQLENNMEKKTLERDTNLERATQSEQLSADIDGYLKSVYFCLLYLGDIARWPANPSSLFISLSLCQIH
jgi:hypothetical protein